MPDSDASDEQKVAASSDGEQGLSPGSRLALAWLPPGSRLAPAWLPPGSRLAPAWLPPGSRLAELPRSERLWLDSAALDLAITRVARHCRELSRSRADADRILISPRLFVLAAKRIEALKLELRIAQHAIATLTLETTGGPAGSCD